MRTFLNYPNNASEKASRAIAIVEAINRELNARGASLRSRKGLCE